MNRPAVWKIATINAAIFGLSLVGAGAAVADPTGTEGGPGTTAVSNSPHEICDIHGANTSHCQSPGDASIVSVPVPSARTVVNIGPNGAGLDHY